MADSLDRIAASLGAARPSLLTAVFSRWEDLVGPDVAAHATPRSLRDGVLTVVVDHPAWASSLRMLSADLLGRISSGEVVELIVQVDPGPGRVRRPSAADARWGRRDADVPAASSPNVAAPVSPNVPAAASPEVRVAASRNVAAPPEVPAPASSNVPAAASPEVRAPACPNVAAPASSNVPAAASPEVPVPAAAVRWGRGRSRQDVTTGRPVRWGRGRVREDDADPPSRRRR